MLEDVPQVLPRTGQVLPRTGQWTQGLGECVNVTEAFVSVTVS